MAQRRTRSGYGTRGHSFCLAGSRPGQGPAFERCLQQALNTGSGVRQSQIETPAPPPSGGLAPEPQSPHLENGNTCFEGLV